MIALFTHDTLAVRQIERGEVAARCIADRVVSDRRAGEKRRDLLSIAGSHTQVLMQVCGEVATDGALHGAAGDATPCGMDRQ